MTDRARGVDGGDVEGPGGDEESATRPPASGEVTAAKADGGFATGHAVPDGGYRWPRIRQIATVTLVEYRLAVRSRWVIALTALFALFGAALATFSGSAVGPEGMERVVASLASLAVYLVPLAALAVGYDAIVGREEEGWLEVVLSLPVTPDRVVVGTYLGRLVVLAGATVLGFGVVGLLLLHDFGGTHWGTYRWFLGATVTLGAVFLAVGLLVSAVAREVTHALGLALLTWVWFVLLHDLLALGVVAAFGLPEAVLTALVLANPATVFRVLVLSQLGTTGAGGFAAALATTHLSTGLLVAALLAWCVVPTFAAIRLTRRR